MAIQMRRGPLAQYDESKMLAGEWGISVDADTNDQKAFIAFAPGVSKEVMMVEDAEEQIAVATAAAIADATEKVEALTHGNSYHVNDYASGDGITRSFTLSETPSSVIAVYVDGAATTAYSRSGSTITFTTAPPAGEDNIRVYYTVNTQYDNAKYYKEQASSSASSASTSASTATTKASQASTSASTASTAATTATTQATKAQSYAVGGTSSRTGEDTDNAKYYKEQAEAAAAMLDAEKILGNFAHYESTATASQAYAVGEHLTYNGYLYRVIADISIGSTISPGTNVMQTTVGDEIQGGKIWLQAKSISNTSGSSGTLCIITDPLITSDHVLTKFVAANRTVITSDVSCTPSPGQEVLTGVSTATTTAEIMLERPDKVL